MSFSIKKFLLINLLLMIIVITVITAFGNYYLNQRDIERNADILLTQAAYSFESLVGNDIHKRDLQELQNQINDARIKPIVAITTNGKKFIDINNEKYQFQVWDKNQKLLLHSNNAPQLPFTNVNTEGLSTQIIKGERWRVFTKINPHTKTKLEVAELLSLRMQLAHQIAIDDIYIILITCPIAALLIWLIVDKGLESVATVTREVSHRVPHYLEPVNSTNVPVEILPLVNELNQLFLRLEQALDREKRFAGDAAHELKTPLAALKTQAQVALKTQNSQERETALQHLIAGVDRCAHVVHQLLTLSRLSPEANTLADTAEINLAKLTAEIMAQQALLALEKEIDMELITDEKQDILLRGNVTALSIMIRNLIDNAIRYTPEKGHIEVIVKKEHGHPVLKIIDSGPGIPAELRARVFERFFRIVGNSAQGSGLGLAIVQQIAQLHNARVRLGAPASGKGLEVVVNFPN